MNDKEIVKKKRWKKGFKLLKKRYKLLFDWQENILNLQEKIENYKAILELANPEDKEYLLEQFNEIFAEELKQKIQGVENA